MSEPEEEEDFARLLEASLAPKSFEVGTLVEGKVVAVGPEVVFVDVGGKGEATIDLAELADADGTLDVKPGDTVQAVVVSSAGGLKLSHRLARGAATRQRLSEAFRAGLPVEGRVERAIKGGYEVRVGGQRAFCPISQIDAHFTADPAVHEGQVYTFRITEYDEQGKDLVLSRRALIEEENRERAEEVRGAIVPGATLDGRVVSVRAYGAFVDLGAGIQGLLHVSEMGWSRVADATSVVRPGDEITVKVLKVEDDKRKISLGLKQLQADPWSTAHETYAVGQVLPGRVSRLTEFGAFIELAPGIDALAHVSTFPPARNADAWKAALPPGAEVQVEILSLDLERRRIGVAVLEEGARRGAQAVAAPDRAGGEAAIAPGARLTGKVERHEKYGVFVFLAPGKTGVVPLEELGLERGTDLRKALPVGSDIVVLVLEVDPAGRRIRLSRKAVFAAEEQTEARDYAQRQEETQAEGFGSLGDKFRAALRPRKDPKS